MLRRLTAAEATRDNMSRQIRGAGEKNRKLVEAITSMRYQVERLRASLSQNVMPPLNSAIVLAVHEGQTMTYEPPPRLTPTWTCRLAAASCVFRCPR